MRAKTPPWRGKRLTILAILITATAGLAGCVNPSESGNGDPDVGPDAVQEEQTFNEQLQAEETFDTSVALYRDTGNVEATLTLTDFRADGMAGGPDPGGIADTEERETSAPDADRDENLTGLEPVTATVQIAVPTPGPGNGDEMRVVAEENVTIRPGESETMTINGVVEDTFWEDYPEGAALTAHLRVTVDDGPVELVGHLRSFH